eukprot:4057867-Heterocapsa_arctica.AAC.2
MATGVGLRLVDGELHGLLVAHVVGLRQADHSSAKGLANVAEGARRRAPAFDEWRLGRGEREQQDGRRSCRQLREALLDVVAQVSLVGAEEDSLADRPRVLVRLVLLARA